jgi:1-acyl-sn-glycerol-3-phosphate acyltransferase
MVNLLRLLAIALITAILGTVGILSCLVVPSGNAVLPLARIWARIIFFLCRVNLTVQGSSRLSALGPYLFLSNHQSQFDILAVVLAIPLQFRILAKQELFYIPIFGWVLKLSGFVGIDRSNREKAIRSLERAAQRLRGGTSLLIYAEGTRSPDGKLLPFKKGGFVLAIQAGVPILPITIQGSREILAKGSLRIRPGTIHLRIGEPIDPARYSLDEKERLMQEVRTAMERAMERGPAPEERHSRE